MDDLISRQAAIDALLHNQEVYSNNFGDDAIDKYTVAIIDNDVQTIAQLPSAQPKISRIEQELHGKTPEEQYEFLHWLLLKFGLAYTDSRFAVVEWLRGEKEDGRFNQQTSGN